MLDAYIIERIRKEKALEQQERAQLPLHIEKRPVSPQDRRPEDSTSDEHGSLDIDFQV